MHVVIDISEKDYEGLKKKDKFNDMFLNYYEKLIAHGTPLPKGHGRLVDVDELSKDDEVTEWITMDAIRTGKNLKMFSELFLKKIADTPTIIEADEAESEVQE